MAMLECKAIADLDEGDIWILRSKLHPFGVQSLACLAPRCKELDSNQLASILSLLNSIGEHDFCCCQNQVFRARCFPPALKHTWTFALYDSCSICCCQCSSKCGLPAVCLGSDNVSLSGLFPAPKQDSQTIWLNTHSTRILRARRDTWPQHPVGALWHLDAY